MEVTSLLDLIGTPVSYQNISPPGESQRHLNFLYEHMEWQREAAMWFSQLLPKKVSEILMSLT